MYNQAMPKQNDYTLTEAELKLVLEALKSPSARVAKRALVLHSLHLGYPPEEIARMQDLSLATVYNHYHRFKAEGIAGLPDKPKAGRPPKADAAYRAKIEATLGTNPQDFGFAFGIWTLPRLALYLEHATGVKLHPDRLAQVLSNMGYVYRRPKKDLGHKQDKAWREQAQVALEELKKTPAQARSNYSIWTKAE